MSDVVESLVELRARLERIPEIEKRREAIKAFEDSCGFVFGSRGVPSEEAAEVMRDDMAWKMVMFYLVAAHGIDKDRLREGVPRRGQFFDRLGAHVQWGRSDDDGLATLQSALLDFNYDAVGFSVDGACEKIFADMKGLDRVVFRAPCYWVVASGVIV